MSPLALTIFIAIFSFITGAAIGSFLSVVVHRVHSGEKGILTGRSKCPKCKKTLKWTQLFPVFSWLFLKGKCGFCKKPIPAIYPIMEVITGLAFVAVALTFSPIYFPLKFAFYIVQIIFLMAIFFYDFLFMEIPDRFSITAIIIAVIGGLYFQYPSPPSMLIGGVVLFLFFAIQFFASGGRWCGGGDMRLGALMGVLLGWQKGLLALFIAYFIGALIAIVLLVTKEAKRKSELPFGPLLISGTFFALFWGDKILDYYVSHYLYF